MVLRVKKCIWCFKTDQEVGFKNEAHTIPASLGGKNICINVCDGCNSYFGNYNDKLPSIEAIFKEAFGVSRAVLLSAMGEAGGKNKILPKYRAIYFNVNFHNKTINLNPSFRIRKNFPTDIARLLKRGIYKVFLEEIERQSSKGGISQYDFIREFARYNIGDLPVIYFQRKIGAFYVALDWIRNPVLHLEEDSQSKYLVNEPGNFEFEFLGQTFGIATTRSWELVYDNYIKKSMAKKSDFYSGWKFVENFSDIDLTLKILGPDLGLSFQSLKSSLKS